VASGFEQVLVGKTLAKQGIIAGSEAKPKSRNQTSGGLKEGNGQDIRENLV
jgi:hypothetical protein